MNFGEKQKCENCIYGYIDIDGRKLKEVFCKKLKHNMSVANYKKMGVCLFFEKEGEI